MPMGSRHTVTGTLGYGQFVWAIHADEGGAWELEFGIITWFRARRLFGRRVVIEGVRTGFNLLSVQSIREAR